MNKVNYIRTDNIEERIVPITYLRRNLGKMIMKLSKTGPLFISKGDTIVAEIRPREKRKAVNLLKFAGLWKGSKLDSDSLWEKIPKDTSAVVKL